MVGRLKYDLNDEAYAMLGVFQNPTDKFVRFHGHADYQLCAEAAGSASK